MTGKRAMCHIRFAAFLLASLFLPSPACTLATPAAAQEPAGIEQSFAASLTTMPTGMLTVSGGFYVPAYSSVSMSQGKLRVDFSVTLSVHNASETLPLVLKRIVYFNTAGEMVESYLKSPVAVKP